MGHTALAPLAVAAHPLARIEGVFRRAEAFTAFDDATIKELARAGAKKRLVRGERIWSYGGAPDHFLIVLSGVIKLVAPVGSKQTILGVFGPSESIGYWAVLDGSTYIGDAYSVSERVEILLVPAKALRDALGRCPRAQVAMHHALLTHSRALRRKIDVMSAGSVPQRLASLLLSLADRFGDEAEDGSTILPVPLGRNDLALLVGTTVETAIRAMRKWQKEGLVETVDGGFVLRDVGALGRVLEGDETVDAVVA